MRERIAAALGARGDPNLARLFEEAFGGGSS
jgi:hypothetical protein